MSVSVKVTGQYARLSRGRITAKLVSNAHSEHWGERGNGYVILDRAGRWMVSQTDGFNRKETVYVVVDVNGEVTEGLGRRMEIID